MSTNAERQNFEYELVDEYNKNNPNDPILATGTKKEIKELKARLWPDGNTEKKKKKRHTKAKEEPTAQN
jgi:hypothetical protein